MTTTVAVSERAWRAPAMASLAHELRDGGFDVGEGDLDGAGQQFIGALGRS